MTKYNTPFQVIDLMRTEWMKFGESKLAGLSKRKDPDFANKEKFYKEFTAALFKKMDTCAKEHVFTKNHVVEPLDQDLANSVFELNKQVQQLQAEVTALSQTVPNKLKSDMDKTWDQYAAQLRQIEADSANSATISEEIDLSGMEIVAALLKKASQNATETSKQVETVMKTSADTISNVEQVLSLSHETETDKMIQTCLKEEKPKAEAEAVLVSSAKGLLSRKRGIDCIENVQVENLLGKERKAQKAIS